MVARCANPQCDREFRELSKGRLFLLPPTPEFGEFMVPTSRLIDYCYWLCPQCAVTHNISCHGMTIVVSKISDREAIGGLDDAPEFMAHLDS